MKAYWLNDGEQVLVTGTLDPGEAIQFLSKDGEDDMSDFVEGLTGDPQRGHIVPNSPAQREYDGYAWNWRPSAGGRCRAVVFR